jgi:hypothetical protein
VRNRLADQGDARFVRLRLQSAEELSRALVAKIDTPPFPEGVACSAEAIATVLVTALERLATVSALELYPQQQADRSDIPAALANMIVAAMRPADELLQPPFYASPPS